MYWARYIIKQIVKEMHFTVKKVVMQPIAWCRTNIGKKMTDRSDIKVAVYIGSVTIYRIKDEISKDKRKLTFSAQVQYFVDLYSFYFLQSRVRMLFYYEVILYVCVFYKIGEMAYYRN